MLKRIILLKIILLLGQTLNPNYTIEDLYKAAQEIAIEESGSYSHYESISTSSVISITTNTTKSALNITTHASINLSYKIQFDNIKDVEIVDSILYVNGQEVARRQNNKGIFLGVFSFPFTKVEIPYAENYHILLATKSFGSYEFDIGNSQALEIKY